MRNGGNNVIRRAHIAEFVNKEGPWKPPSFSPTIFEGIEKMIKSARVGLVGALSAMLGCGGWAMAGAAQASPSTPSPLILPTAPSAAASTPPFGHGMALFLGWDHRNLACESPGAGHYAYITIQWYMATDTSCSLAQIHADNPGAKVLAYQDFGAMISDTSGVPSTGVTQQQANAHDKANPQDSWYLHSPGGQRLDYPDYPYIMAANVGRRSYWRAWERHVAAIQAAGFDGIMADDVNTNPAHQLGQCSGCTSIAEYPTDQAYGTAVTRAMANIGPYVKSQGMVFAANVGVDPWTDWERADALSIAGSISAYMREFWTRYNGTDPNLSGAAWEANATLEPQVEAAGAAFLANTYYGPSSDGTTADEQYGVASWWLMWDGQHNSGWGYNNGPLAFDAGWGPDLGAPTDPSRVAQGVGWTRHYTGGVAVVNPSSNTAQTFDLGGIYSEPDGTQVTSVTIPPTQGMVLTGI